MTDIVAKLKSPATIFYEYAADEGGLLHEAAAAIEALRAENARLARSRNRWGNRYNKILMQLRAAVMTDTDYIREVDEACEKASAERDALRAENARLLEALKRLLYAGHTIDENKLAKHEWSFWADELRAARAAIGETDDGDNKKD